MEHLFIINNEFLYMHQRFSFNVFFLVFFRNLFSPIFRVRFRKETAFQWNSFTHSNERITERGKNDFIPFLPKYCLTYDNDSWFALSNPECWLHLTFNKMHVKCCFIRGFWLIFIARASVQSAIHYQDYILLRRQFNSFRFAVSSVT